MGARQPTSSKRNGAGKEIGRDSVKLMVSWRFWMRNFRLLCDAQMIEVIGERPSQGSPRAEHDTTELDKRFFRVSDVERKVYKNM